MREAEPLDPEIVAALEAIDATLEGEPVDPDLAELAELSLILRDGAPEPDPAFLGRLDARVGARFAAPAPARARAPGRARSSHRRAWTGVATLAVAMIAALAVVVVHPGGGTSTSSSGASSSASLGSSAGSASGGVSSRSATATSPTATNGNARSLTPGPDSPATPTNSPAPRPPSAPGRQLAQSANLDLQARAGHIDQVAQGVFDVVGAEHGSVTSSHVTSEAHGPSDASFRLSVPSTRLEAALDRLSHLSHARVISREDASRDITAQIGGAGTQLADARALRRSLLHQLAGAYTTHDIDHLKAQLRRNEATIARDETSLQRLHRRASDSTIAVDVSAPPVTSHHHHHAGSGSGFTIHRALHDSVQVLLVAAGVLLIAVAVLIPLALVVAVIAWVWTFVLRRRREAVLEG